jgi:hypothetical protein
MHLIDRSVRSRSGALGASCRQRFVSGEPRMLESRSRSSRPDQRPLREQPRWRRDFAIDWPEDNYVARRDFGSFSC